MRRCDDQPSGNRAEKGEHARARRRTTRHEQLSYFARRHVRTLLPAVTLERAANIALALAEMAGRTTRCRSRPFIYRIDPCSRCNIRCIACPATRVPPKLQGTMRLADFERISEQIHRPALRVSLYDMGEPLLNRDIYKMLRILSAHKVSTSISTNFTTFEASQIEPLFDSGLTLLQPCLDGVTRQSYSRYRRGGDVERVKANIRLVMQERRRRRRRLPYVDVQVILFDFLRGELAAIARFLQKAGVDRATYRPDFLGIETSHPGWIDQGPPHPGGCFWLYCGMAVGPNGDVRPCCGQGFDPAVYGNLAHEALATIWNNRYYRFSRSLFRPGPALTPPPELARLPCVSCTRFTRRRDVKLPPSTVR